MNYNFVGDVDALNELYTTIVNETAKVKTALDSIYETYEELGTGGADAIWSGTNYNTFIRNARAQKPNMYKCLDSFGKFAEQVKDAKNGVQQILTEMC